MNLFLVFSVSPDPKPGMLFEAQRTCFGLLDRPQWARMDALHHKQSLGSVTEGRRIIIKGDILLFVKPLKDSLQFVHGAELVWMWKHDMWDKELVVFRNLKEVRKNGS